MSDSRCEKAVLLLNSSFSRDRSRKRHERRAVGRSLLHNLIALAPMVRTATLNMQLEALRDQQQLWENCFLKMVVRRRLWKDATPLKRLKQPNVRARRACLGSKRGCHGAGFPPHTHTHKQTHTQRNVQKHTEAHTRTYTHTRTQMYTHVHQRQQRSVTLVREYTKIQKHTVGAGD